MGGSVSSTNSKIEYCNTGMGGYICHVSKAEVKSSS